MGEAERGGRKTTPQELAAYLLVAIVLVWVYAGHVASMADNWWNDPNYSHGILVPLISVYLILRHKEKLPSLVTKPNPWGLLVIAFGLVLLAVGYMASEFFLKRISLIPVLWGLVLMTWGWPVAKRLAFPFAYLVFMVPLPYVIYDSVAFPLRLIAASLAGGILHELGTPTLVEGNVIHLPNFVLNVVDACSGIRSLISLLAAGSILAYLILPNRWSKVLMVLVVFPVAVLTNAVRVVVAGLLAKTMGMAAIEGSNHDLVGWAVFMIGFLFLAGLTLLVRYLLVRWGGASASQA